MNTELNELAAKIHAQNVDAGWWKDMNRDVYQCLQLVSTELAEATEGERKNLMDDHLPHRKMGEVELADALIRLFDLAGRYGWVYLKYDIVEDELAEMITVAGMHFICNWSLSRLGECVFNLRSNVSTDVQYTRLVNTILRVGTSQGYDVMTALHEKLEYNKHRADHKPEARAAEHGKKF